MKDRQVHANSHLSFVCTVLAVRLLMSTTRVSAGAAQAAVEQREIDAPPPQAGIGPGGVWPSEPPADCPFPPSETLKGLRFTGRHAEYTGADTWYPSWASDGNLYSPWTDGDVNGLDRRFSAARRPPPAMPRSSATIR